METIVLKNPRIGVTERGDAGRMLDWVEKVKQNQVDMAVLITKCVTHPFIDKVMELTQNGARLIVHCGCTGLGRTDYEPGSPAPIIQLRSLNMLLLRGFPIERCVLRVDPVIPTEYGLNRMRHVLKEADRMFGLENIRVRISVLDEYPHVKQRLRNAGMETIYPGNQFYASPEQFRAVETICAEFPQARFETCAEPSLRAINIKRQGCVSDADLALCGIVRTGASGINMQNRTGCLCLAGKKELLSQKHPCGSKCIYCYWKDAAAQPDPNRH